MVNPQKEKREPVFVRKGTSAEDYARLNKNKEVRPVNNTIRLQNIVIFLSPPLSQI